MLIPEPKPVMVEIKLIRLDGGTQMRESICDEVVADYVECLEEGDQFPPIVVFHDAGNPQKDYWLGDGFHRVHAARKAGRRKILAKVQWGGQREAILYAVAANFGHGLRRTNADKRRAVMALLNDEEWSTWSDHKIADKVGVSQPFVSGLRNATSSDNGYRDDGIRTCVRNGTEYQIATSGINAGRDRPQEVPDSVEEPTTDEAEEQEATTDEPETEPQPEPNEFTPDPESVASQPAWLAHVEGLWPMVRDLSFEERIQVAERLEKLTRDLLDDAQFVAA